LTLTCSLLIALTVSTGTAGTGASPTLDTDSRTLAHAVKITPLRATTLTPKAAETWMFDRPQRRPSALPVMYAALGALQALDVYSTQRAIGAGASEANSLMKQAAGSSATMVAAKALSAAGTIYFTERAWKKNRKGAVIMMAIVNGAMAAITARNFKNAQR
jgi:hypothetical protein